MKSLLQLALPALLWATALPAQANRPPAPAVIHAQTQAEYDAYRFAATQHEPAELEAAAIEFAQRFPNSSLRALLFQQAMADYQQRHDDVRALAMARQSLKYDPAAPVVLATAAEILAEQTHDSDPDRDARLEEAQTLAEAAQQHLSSLRRPATLEAAQFAQSVDQLRANIHQTLAAIAFLRRDDRAVMREYRAALALRPTQADAVVWLRLATSEQRSGELAAAHADVERALAASTPGSNERTLAERLRARLTDTATPQPATPPTIAPTNGQAPNNSDK